MINTTTPCIYVLQYCERYLKKKNINLNSSVLNVYCSMKTFCRSMLTRNESIVQQRACVANKNRTPSQSRGV